MALTGTNRGSGNHNSAATSFTLNPGSNLTAGAMAVLCVAADNAGASGAAMATFSVTDSLGNTWTRRSSPLYDPGAASVGVEGAIFTTPMNVGTLVTGTVITVSFGGTSVTAKTWTLIEVVGSQGVPTFKTQAVGTGSATASPTVTTSSLTNGTLVVGAVFIEGGTTLTLTGDADTSNGNWSTAQSNKIGSTTSGSGIISQFKTVTATGTQTYNPTIGLSSDCIAAWISVGENVSVSPGTGSVVFSGVAPTASSTSNQSASPGTGTVIFSGIAPAASSSNNQSASPGTGTTSFTGIAPTASSTNNQSAAPGTGGVVFSGVAPTINITDNQVAAPGTGVISFNGVAPAAISSDHQRADPGTGQVIFSGVAPVAVASDHQFAEPGTAVVIFNGIRPSYVGTVGAEPTGSGNFPIFNTNIIRGTQNGIR